MEGDIDFQKIIPEVARMVAASRESDSQRSHENALEAAEIAAWDAFALTWMKEGSDPAEITIDAAADFADKMIDRRRKYFGMEVPPMTAAKPPEEGA